MGIVTSLQYATCVYGDHCVDMLLSFGRNVNWLVHYLLAFLLLLSMAADRTLLVYAVHLCTCECYHNPKISLSGLKLMTVQFEL